MSEENSELLGTGLFYETRIPFGWRESSLSPGSRDVLQLQGSNERALHLIAFLEEHQPDPAEEAGEGDEFARLDFKLNLLLDLVGQLLLRDQRLPESCAVKICVDGMEWEGKEAPEMGQLIAMELHLTARCPTPVVLQGRVESVEPLPNRFRIVARFDTLGEPVRELLQKIVFRHHRDRKSTRLNSSHTDISRMPSSA